jgi:hypothetical protein
VRDTLSFLGLIEAATHEMQDAVQAGREPIDPDGYAVREALLLAERAATAADTAPDAESVAWDLYGVLVGEAVADLQAELTDPALLPDTVRPGVQDGTGLPVAARQLTAVLAEVFAAAAVGQTGSPWRRLVWARVAYRLDEAVAELQ